MAVSFKKAFSLLLAAVLVLFQAIPAQSMGVFQTSTLADNPGSSVCLQVKQSVQNNVNGADKNGGVCQQAMNTCFYCYTGVASPYRTSVVPEHTGYIIQPVFFKKDFTSSLYRPPRS